jgi:gliding-associated putative ABC transporter substrate-binding component GldG
MAGKRHRGAVIVEIIVVAAVIAFVNLLSIKFFIRADLTEGRVFSVSESTKQVLRDLDDIVHIKVYFSKKLPPYMATLTQQVRDILDEYQAYAGKNIIIDFEDPAQSPETEQRVRSLGIPQVQMNIIEKDKAEVVNGYLGMAILYEDRSEVLPVVSSAANLEYDLTSAVIKVTMDEIKTVAFLKVDPERDLAAVYESWMTELRNQYEVTEVAVSDGSMVPDNVNTLVVAGPKGLSAWDNYAIDQFLMRGGRALFLIDRISIIPGEMAGERIDTGIDSLLATYGVEVRPDLVVDRSSGTATFVSGYVRFSLPYLLWPMVLKETLDDVSPITNQLERVIFTWTSSINLMQPAGGPVEVTVLATSSEQSWSEERRLNLDPQQRFIPMTDTGPRNLAVLLEGSFQSHFAGRDVPVETVDAPVREKLDRSTDTQIIVIGNSRFTEQSYLSQYPENRTFLLNAVDWLTLGESLIGIRSRTVTSRPVREIGEGAKATVRFIATFGVPLAVIIWGLSRRHLKKRRRLRR